MAAAALVGLCLWIPAELAGIRSAVVPVLHMDGAFQTFNGLLRLSDGQVPGRDFFPYLGAGPLLLLFPLYALLGSTVTSSVFASTFATLVALEVTFALLAVLVFRPRSWLFPLSAALVPVVSVYFASDVMRRLTPLNLDVVIELAEPGNSLRPLRAFAPYLLVLAVLAITSTVRSQTWRSILFGTTCGALAAVWSNDYALVSASVMLLALSFHGALTPRWRLRHFALLWGSAGIGLLATGLLVTAGNFSAYLRYNLVDVRGDQYWYFGPWTTQSRINTPGDLVAAFRAEGLLLSVAVLALVLVTAMIRRDKQSGLLAYLGCSLLLGGLAASVGGHVGGYFSPFRLWAGLTLCLLVLKLLADVFLTVEARTPRLTSGARKKLVKGVAIAASLGIAIASVSVAVQATADQRSLRQDLRANNGFVYDEQFGGYLDSAFSQHLSLNPGSREDLLEEYAGLMTAKVGPRTDLPVDSVIHALGSQRAEYAAALGQTPQTVVTSSPGIGSGEWIGWNISANWWFYRDLFRSYLPEQTSPTTILWRPSPERRGAGPAVPCHVRSDGVEIYPPVRGLYEVTVYYEGPGAGSRTFSMIRNGINQAMGADGFVALDPSATSQSLPVYADEAGDITMSLKDVGRQTDEPVTTIQACTAARVLTPSTSQADDIYAPIFAAARTPQG